MSEPMPPGARLVARAFRTVPALRAARLDDARLARLRARPLPESGAVAALAGLVVGRVPAGVVVTTDHHGALPLRLYTPAGTSPRRALVLALHGGGFVLGSARQQDWLHGRVARDLDAVVVAPDYRLAPEHPFPAAVDDAWDALGWAVGHAAALGADAARTCLLGESAGGTLAAVTARRAVDEGLPGGARVVHQSLLYPPVDLTEALARTASYAEHHAAAIGSAAALRWFRDAYLGPRGDAADPRCSPALAEARGLPPTCVVLAGHDPLRDAAAAYADALAAAGTVVEVVDAPGMPHGFLGFPRLARDAAGVVDAVVADAARATG
ncbi:alpha/beta hydrolase fold domain-containing protein [Nocardioides sp. CFH 31398]|uniref:alpha/beta hydrolase fold domain-containing protein n=1 Tax=Nocardioides sp. CFH 31398 TaxID=2919579 RepID=UPI001F0689D8|nr:alpha/beta hydrolase fold domain-containing protein [Nocardioides sp. CFH 31398]MCH1866986.1 alpha/beta hydrolase [Nocardioides sp. CFH 31398]